MEKKKLEVGQTVWLEKYNRITKKKELTNMVVSQVGRKYFKLIGYERVVFDIEKMYDVSDYTPSLFIHLTQQDYLDKAERKKLNTEVIDFFKYGGSKLSLDQLRQIKQIITQN